MIEHLFMLRCMLHPDIPIEHLYINAQVIERNGNTATYCEAIPAYFATCVWPFQLPREAASLKDNPDVIQCEECQGIFPMEFIHIKSIFRYGAYFDRIDLCEACWKGLGR